MRESAANTAGGGGRPLGIPTCLHRGAPERPEGMCQFAERSRGLRDACIVRGTPVVSGNVSFYNETEGRAVLPTPTVGMVGILERDTDGCEIAFPESGLDIILIGETRDELGGSEWQQSAMPDALAAPPRVDLDREKALVEFFLAAYEHRLLRSAHDVSNGGLAIALAECAMDGIGCHIEFADHANVDTIALLFSESQGRALVSTSQPQAVVNLAKQHGINAMRIGRTETATFLIERNGIPLIRTAVPELARIWRTSFALLLGGDSVDDVIRGIGEEAPEVLAH